MGMEYGKVSVGIHTLESGGTQRQRGMECTYGRMETDMKESGKGA